jgi:hypothetical protein
MGGGGPDGRRWRGSDAGGGGCGSVAGGSAVARVGRGGDADALRCEEKFFSPEDAGGRLGNSPISVYLWDYFFG